MEQQTVLSTRGLVKRYGDVVAVDGVDLHVRRGEIYGFLGRNGAGKTTTIRMMLGLISPTAGEVTLLGTKIRTGEQEVFRHVGSLIETASAYPNLTVRENLEIQRRLTGCTVADVDEVIELLQLGPYTDRPVGKLSQGNRQRHSLARTLVHKPEVLVLDEPVNSLDPAGIIEVRKLLRRLAEEQGVTIFMSSHILVEVAHIADRIGIVHNGRLIEELDYDELQAKARTFVDLEVSDAGRAVKLLARELGISQVEQVENGRLRLFDGQEKIPEIARLLVNSGLELKRLAAEAEDLEAHFIRLTEGA